ncbi:DUF2499 domain-containing protein [Thiocystis violascens]|uniref:Uncharacterized protein n=1 Tax=Thiocystis violascens (strain ATCC 17096 / DSM 198 / 6111) TaxID=765911 RepID=I3YE72_THIV6|nr:DUF2499 domain-containing protein [Thiocystis violascens]AFL75290.1 Protein of unknown function (DUF2499)/Protein of unknown function (DUF3593) [Thiocystis violascens DSM 198]
MLLSWPTWLIHLFTVTEWLVAMRLFWRYGTLIQRREPRVFAVCMTPHLLGGILILLFHLSGDTQRWLLELARVMTFGGSLSLLAATLAMTLGRRQRWAWVIVPAGLLWALAQWPLLGDSSAVLLRGANVAYLLFLLTLLLVYRRDRTLFSPVTIGGFWFLLAFVAVTILSTRIATVTQGLPSLSHADLLHGASESLLSVSNLLVALGVFLHIQRFGRPTARRLDGATQTDGDAR